MLEQVERAASAVEAGVIAVARDVEGVARYLVIQRADDWTLPKGHREDTDVDLEATAIRELDEEAGIHVTAMAPVGVFSYRTDSDARQVHYFMGTYAGAVDPPHALDGVLQTRWLPRELAGELLTHDDLREFFLSVTKPSPNVSPASPLAIALKRRRLATLRPGAARLERISTAIDVFANEMVAVRGRSTVDPRAAAWRAPGDRLLELSKQLAMKEDIDAAWETLHASKRLALLDLSDDEVQTVAASRRLEADKKLTGWRRQAVTDLLPKASAQPATTPTTPTVSRESLIEAIRLMDEESANVYLKLRMGGVALPIAAGLLSVILALLIVAVWNGWFASLEGERADFVLTDRGLLGGAMVLGAFGSMLSITLDTNSASLVGRRIYELAFAHVAVPAARLAIGASSGVLVVAAAQSTLADAGQAWTILAAIPAGFSERLVRQTVETLDVSASGSPGRTG
ncbi:8-oxo-dGTP pyrophosphatase MutT (NUDIX family) [Nocardioides sp. BE266]|uniref:NUDIX hydrolase n=1 Tax=Nocardioides sp. BE266 TaxID=2817725 RepID=UPI002857F3FD|nr:NUDIX hydrolase [Nocardioides sp. BE266]MDR7251238.1 8-oxo-dGTP pyrophosphatase MutT (NUDIX family) [Nocardioides sp. BE266]